MQTAHDTVTLPELLQAQRYVARQMTEHGCTWLTPLFERLETEIAKAQAINETVARAHAFLKTTK